jgi:hypothetical protein
MMYRIGKAMTKKRRTITVAARANTWGWENSYSIVLC